MQRQELDRGEDGDQPIAKRQRYETERTPTNLANLATGNVFSNRLVQMRSSPHALPSPASTVSLTLSDNYGARIYYISSVPDFGGGAQAGCIQLKLANQLFLSIMSRGRFHYGDLNLSFFTKPARLAIAQTVGGSGRLATAQAGGGNGASAENPNEEVEGGGNNIDDRSCSYAEWRRLWGPDVNTPPRTFGPGSLSANASPHFGIGCVKLENCGVSLSFETGGRNHVYELQVRSSPMRCGFCLKCNAIDLQQLEAAAARNC